MRRTWILLSMLPTLVQAGDAAAQAPGTGTWFGFGAGGGWTRVSCAICSTDRDLGPAGQVRIGTSIRPGLLVGAEASAWTHTDDEQDDVRETVATLAGVGYVYPRPGGPLYLKGGAGYIAYRAGDDVAANLFGLLVGAGYEFPLSDSFAITNDLSLVATSFGALKNGDATAADDVSVTVLQLAVGIRRR
jgi:hypothetical protein